MATNPLPYDASVIASVNAFTALANSGFLEFYTGSQPALDGALTGTKLAKLAMSATAFAAATASAGTVTATANAITTAAALATGTAGYWALMKSDDATVVMTGSVGTSGADINLNTTSFVSGVNVTVSAFSITEPQT
jgi:hypothetical protein